MPTSCLPYFIASMQVKDLSEASKSISTLHSLLDLDVDKNCVRQAGSHSRNLLRVKRGLDMVKVLFEQILASEYAATLTFYLLVLCLLRSFLIYDFTGCILKKWNCIKPTNFLLYG